MSNFFDFAQRAAAAFGAIALTVTLLVASFVTPHVSTVGSVLL